MNPRLKTKHSTQFLLLFQYLKNSIRSVIFQVAEVQAAISVLSDGEEKNKLIELEADLKEIIQLSKNSLHCQKEDPLLEEYNLFKVCSLLLKKI